MASGSPWPPGGLTGKTNMHLGWTCPAAQCPLHGWEQCALSPHSPRGNVPAAPTVSPESQGGHRQPGRWWGQRSLTGWFWIRTAPGGTCLACHLTCLSPQRHLPQGRGLPRGLGVRAGPPALARSSQPQVAQVTQESTWLLRRPCCPQRAVHQAGRPPPSRGHSNALWLPCLPVAGEPSPGG